MLQKILTINERMLNKSDIKDDLFQQIKDAHKV